VVVRRVVSRGRIDENSPGHPQEGAALLRIEEAAQLLRIGRSLAYKLAHEFLTTGERAGFRSYDSAAVYESLGVDSPN
jgi:hypothetical protein